MDDRLPGIRPRPSVGRRLDVAARRLLPTASTALLLLLTAAPLGLPGQAELQASVALACVFFWSLFRPASMPPPLVFLLGLLIDLLGFAPIGRRRAVAASAARPGAALAAGSWSRQGFVVVWLCFVAMACGASAMQWALTSVLVFRLLPPGPGLFQAALAAGLYPALAVILTRVHQTLAEPGLA